MDEREKRDRRRKLWDLDPEKLREFKDSVIRACADEIEALREENAELREQLEKAADDAGWDG